MPKKKAKKCPFKSAGVTFIDYKVIPKFFRYTSTFEKIVPRYYTNVSLKYQKRLSQAIKRARVMGLIPFTK